MYFIDIETVPQHESIDKSPLKGHFVNKFIKDFSSSNMSQDQFEYESQELYRDKAGLYAEFGKIVCVCIGYIKDDEIRVKIFCGRHEKIILQKLSEIIDKNERSVTPLCAHNGYEFDFPWLFRRYQINGLPIPLVINVNHLKKWEWPLHDTMTMWSHTQWNYKASLDLLCNILNIPSPKSDVSGANVSEIYYGMFDDNGGLPFDKETEALEKIGNYCAGDVIALAKIYCKLKGLPVPTKSAIVE